MAKRKNDETGGCGELVKMRKTHADLAKAMLTKAAKAMQALPEDEITASYIARMIEVGTRLERLSREEYNPEGGDELALSLEKIDLSRLSDGELMQLEELTRKLSEER